MDVRFLAATHRSLDDLAASGQFRKDLLFRLKGFVLTLPALRERRHEFPYLVPRLAAIVAGALPNGDCGGRRYVGRHALNGDVVVIGPRVVGVVVLAFGLGPTVMFARGFVEMCMLNRLNGGRLVSVGVVTVVFAPVFSDAIVLFACAFAADDFGDVTTRMFFMRRLDSDDGGAAGDLADCELTDGEPTNVLYRDGCDGVGRTDEDISPANGAKLVEHE